MKATHNLFRWYRFEDQRKYTKEIAVYKAFIKKDGTVVYWTPGGRKPYRSYLNSVRDAKTKRAFRYEMGGKTKKCFMFHTLEPINGSS